MARTVVCPVRGCLLWTGAKDRKGYGRVKVGGRVRRVHRVLYELCVGPIPDEHVLDHECRVHACVHPAHVEPVTNRVNTLRGESFAARHAQKTHCPRGHELAGDNLVARADRPGTRECLACKRLRRVKVRPRPLVKARPRAKTIGGSPCW
jgi:hypothetical protein